MKQALFVCFGLFLSLGGQTYTSNTVPQNNSQNNQQSQQKGQKSGQASSSQQNQNANSTNSQIPVPLQSEPHHHLVLQNSYVQVFNVEVPSSDATLLHQHDLPYLYVVLGPANFINAVTGKPEAPVKLNDGAVRYSPGHFSHLVRTDSGVAFHNITIELVQPQTSPRNLCEKVMDGPLGICPQKDPPGERNEIQAFQKSVPYFETDEVRVERIRIEGGKDYEEDSPRLAALLVALSDANLDVSLASDHAAFLHGGDVLWLPAGKARKIADFLGTKSSFLILSFKVAP